MIADLFVIGPTSDLDVSQMSSKGPRNSKNAFRLPQSKLKFELSIREHRGLDHVGILENEPARKAYLHFLFFFPATGSVWCKLNFEHAKHREPASLPSTRISIRTCSAVDGVFHSRRK